MHDMFGEGKHNMYMVFPLLFNIQMKIKKKKENRSTLILSPLPQLPNYWQLQGSLFPPFFQYYFFPSIYYLIQQASYFLFNMPYPFCFHSSHTVPFLCLITMVILMFLQLRIFSHIVSSYISFKVKNLNILASFPMFGPYHLSYTYNTSNACWLGL